MGEAVKGIVVLKQASRPQARGSFSSAKRGLLIAGFGKIYKKVLETNSWKTIKRKFIKDCLPA